MTKIAMIPAAGRGSRMMSLTENNPKAMLPFNCKPIIGHHLDYLIKEGFKDVVIIVGYQKEKLINYVNQFYGTKINIRFAEQKELNGLAGAVYEGIKVLTQKEKDEYSLLILLGDIVLDMVLPPYTTNFIGHDIVEDWSRWCMIEEENGVIKRFIDKPDEKPNTNKNVMGVYNLTEIDIFESCLEYILGEGKKIKNEYQISQALDYYVEYATEHVFPCYISDYYDLGELDALNKTRKNVARHFNSIEVTEDNTVIKKSSNIQKMADEVNWYENIPNKLKLYTPQVVDYGEGWYELEFIHSSPIQELYLFNLPEHFQWVQIFKTIKKFIDKARQANFSLDTENHMMLVDKTIDRVSKVKELPFAKDSFVTINNIVYKNPIKHMDKILELVKNKLCVNTFDYSSWLHGDLFFGNMLYDVNTGSLKVIDPRGDYGGYLTFGDIRYDIAKLNHSVFGYYDFIINGLYFLEENDNKFFYHFYESRQHEVQEIFKEIILADFDSSEIRLITGLLFLTMIPLHSENHKNQKMQFIKAVEFLNEFI